MASDIEYVNYNENSENEYDNTTQNNSDQTTEDIVDPDLRRNNSELKSTSSSGQRPQSLFDEDLYSLPTGADVSSTKRTPNKSSTLKSDVKVSTMREKSGKKKGVVRKYSKWCLATAGIVTISVGIAVAVTIYQMGIHHPNTKGIHMLDLFKSTLRQISFVSNFKFYD